MIEAQNKSSIFSNIKTSDEIIVMNNKISYLTKYILDRKPDSIIQFSHKIHKSDLIGGFICQDQLAN